MTTAPPPGILTGKPSPPGCRIAVPGMYHLNMIPAVSANRWLDEKDRHHDGSLIVGETEAHGPVSVHYDTAAQVDALIAAATVYRDWLKAAS